MRKIFCQIVCLPKCVYMTIRTSTLAKFIRLGGYETVKRVQRGRLKGRWKNLSKASKKTGISRPTIYKILEKYPQKPIINKPKTLKQLEKSESYKRFMQLYGTRLDKSNLKQNIRYMQIAIKMLEGKTPEFWTINDYKKIWYAKEFYSKECRGINKRIGVYFKRIMKADDRFDLLEKFKYNAPPTGNKKQWFLHEREIKALIKCIQKRRRLYYFFWASRLELDTERSAT